MPDQNAARFFSAAKVVAVATFLSRILGLVRESVLAALFGAGWVLDAFYLAFLPPNLLRRLFGEGALSASLVPVFTEQRETDPDGARRLASTVLTMLTAGLGLLVVFGEIGLLLLWTADPDNRERALFCRLAMVMLSFLPTICAVAVQGALLNVLGKFGAAALAPAVLNVCMISAVIPPWDEWTGDPHARITAVAIGVSVAGLLEFLKLRRALAAAGMPITWMWDRAAPGLRKVGTLMTPMLLGLGVLQLMEFVGAAVVRALTAPAHDPAATMSVMGWEFVHPLREGSLSVLQCAQRLYQFPLGVFATALGTAVFPLFSLCVAKGDHAGFGDAVGKALRLSLFIGIPAGAGLVLIAEPACRLLFERGRFGPDDTARTAATVAWYGAGLWAFCLHQIVVRACQARSDSRSPMRVALLLLPVNFALNVGLVFVPGMGVAGVAAGTAITFGVASLWLLSRVSGTVEGGIPLRGVLTGAGRTAAATAVMAVACVGARAVLPDLPGTWGAAVMTFGMIGAGGVAFLGVCRVMGFPEVRELLQRAPRGPAAEPA